MKRHIKKRSFTKCLLILFIAVALALTVTTVLAALAERSGAETLARVTEVWYGGLSVVVAFYLWKAKSENRHKYSQAWVNDIGEKYGWEAAARFAEIDAKGD